MLTAEGLAKQYRGRRVIQDFSLRVEQGEVVGLLGPNGAGKTTCFYMVVGLVRADGGSIRIDGKDITTLPMNVRARLGIGYLHSSGTNNNINSSSSSSSKINANSIT